MIPASDDGRLTEAVGAWAEEKYRHVGMYAEMFATAMKNMWNCRVYIDLFAGSGHSEIRNTDKVVFTSPLISLSLPDSFDRYIFCDKSQDNIEALAVRVKELAPDADVRYVVGDVNKHCKIAEILSHIPAHSKDFTVMSFCFADPYRIRDLNFDTIRLLGAERIMDFLILLALGMDANRNVEEYAKEDNDTLQVFLDNSEWRAKWNIAKGRGENLVYFLASRYVDAMTGLGFRRRPVSKMHLVRSDRKKLPLYYLALFSKHDRAYRFWDDVLKYSTQQLGLDI